MSFICPQWSILIRCLCVSPYFDDVESGRMITTETERRLVIREGTYIFVRYNLLQCSLKKLRYRIQEVVSSGNWFFFLMDEESNSRVDFIVIFGVFSISAGE